MSDSESTDSSSESWSITSDEENDLPKKVKNKIKHFLDRSRYFYHNQARDRHNSVKTKSYYDPVSQRYYDVYKRISNS